jgi:hypothetical protein
MMMIREIQLIRRVLTVLVMMSGVDHLGIDFLYLTFEQFISFLVEVELFLCLI